MKPSIHDLIKHSFSSTDFSFSTDDVNYLLTGFERIHIPGKTIITHIRSIEKYIYFIEKGAVRYWFRNKKNNEISFLFAFENRFVTSYDSLIKEIPSDFSIQTISACVMWRIGRERVMPLLASNISVNMLFRLALNNAISERYKREIILLRLTPIERYRYIMLNEKRLIREIPLKYLCTYIGITQPALSKIRSRIRSKRLTPRKSRV